MLPILGAGSSHDCGMRLGKQIGEDLYNDYLANSAYAPHAAGLNPELGEVADAIFDKAARTRSYERSASTIRRSGLQPMPSASTSVPTEFSRDLHAKN